MNYFINSIKQKEILLKLSLLVDKLYEKDKNAKWIAEKGVLIFENSKDKDDKKMIEDVSLSF